jgi:hypothetical protein
VKIPKTQSELYSQQELKSIQQVVAQMPKLIADEDREQK